MTAFSGAAKRAGEGRNIAIEYRWAEADTIALPRLCGRTRSRSGCRDRARRQRAIRAARGATATIPIVFTHGDDPVSAGFVASLAPPGGNVTGFTLIRSSLAAKWLELLQQIAPGLNAIG